MSFFTDSPFERIMLQRPHYKRAEWHSAHHKGRPFHLSGDFSITQSTVVNKHNLVVSLKERSKSR